MSASLVIFWSLVILALLIFLAVETFHEFKRMHRDPDGFSGSDRLGGTGE